MAKKIIELSDSQMVVEKSDEILITRTYYKICPTSEIAKVFSGHTIPLPTSLIFFLKETELKTFIVIFEEIRKTGHCLLHKNEIAEIINVSPITINGPLARLAKLGIIYYKEFCNRRREIAINFEAIQKIENMASGYMPNAPIYLRKAIGYMPILECDTGRLTDILKTHCTKREYDPIESEEYI